MQTSGESPAAYEPDTKVKAKNNTDPASKFRRTVDVIMAHPNRAIVGVTIIVIAAMIGGSFLETRNFQQRLTTTVFRTNSFTAYSTVSHLKDYLDSRAGGLLELSEELTNDRSIEEKRKDIDSFLRFANKQHVEDVLLFSPAGIVDYSVSNNYDGTNFSKTRFWNYVEKVSAQYAASSDSTMTGKRFRLSVKPFAGSADTTNLLLIGLPVFSKSTAGRMRLEGAVALLVNQFGVIPPPQEMPLGMSDTTSKIGLGFFTRGGYPFIHLWSNVPAWNTKGVAKLQAGGRRLCVSCHRAGDISTILGGAHQLGTGFVKPDSPAPAKGEFLWTSAKLTSSSVNLQDSVWYVVVSVDKAPVAASINSYVRGSVILTVAIILLLVVILTLGFYAHRQSALDSQRTEHLEQVAKVREQYEVLIEKSNDGIYIISEGRFVFVNKRFEELFGYTLEELAGIDFMRLVAPESIALVKKRIERTKRGESIEPTYSFAARSKDGRVVPVEVSVSHAEHEGSERTIGIVRDLSELTAQKQLYEDLFNHAPIGLAIYRNFKAIKVNNAASEMMGYDAPEELIGAHIFQFVHPDDLPMVRDRVKKAMEKRIPAPPYEERFLRRDGSSFHALVLSQPVIYEREEAVQIAFVSLEDRKKLEENLEREAAVQELEKIRLDTLLQNLNEGILFQGADGKIEFVNAEFCRIMGIDDCSKIIGMSSDEVLVMASRVMGRPDEFVSHVKRDVEERRVVEDERYELNHGLVVERSALPIYDPLNNYIGRLTIFRDVTARERNEDAIKKLQRTELLGRLAGGIAHDFNNVLAIIIGSIQMLLRKIDNQASVRDHAQRALSSAFRGSEISKRLLQFVRYSPRGFEVFSLRQIIEETSSILRHTFEESVTVHVDFTIDDAHIYGSPGDLQQVLINLANNSRDAMPAGGSITISLSIPEQRRIERRLGDVMVDRFVLVTVRDTGEGIEEDKLEKIFDPFFTTKDIGKGTGLGLSIVQTIISAHGGFVEVESRSGSGTEFFLYLPTTDATPNAKDIFTHGESSEPTINARRATILVVEDEPGLRELLLEFLSDRGFNVITARDGEEGLRLFESHPDISVVLSDLGLPRLGGDELLARIKAQKPKVKCILATGYLTAKAGGNMDQLDIKMIMKPYNLGAIQALLTEVLAG